MKISHVIFLIMPLILAFSACKKEDTPEDTGTIVWKTKTGAFKMNKVQPGSNKVDSTYSCNVVDVGNQLHFLSVSSEAIVEGRADDLLWYPIIVASGALQYSNDRPQASIDVPPGTYSNIKLRQGYSVNWKIECDSTIMEIPTSNSQCDTNALATGTDFIQYLNAGGTYYQHVDDGTFTKCYCCGGESMGGFQVSAGKTTTVTMRLNFDTLDWVDADSNGIWTSGDYIDNITTHGGGPMMVFDVEYE